VPYLFGENRADRPEAAACNASSFPLRREQSTQSAEVDAAAAEATTSGLAEEWTAHAMPRRDARCWARRRHGVMRSGRAAAIWQPLLPGTGVSSGCCRSVLG